MNTHTNTLNPATEANKRGAGHALLVAAFAGLVFFLTGCAATAPEPGPITPPSASMAAESAIAASRDAVAAAQAAEIKRAAIEAGIRQALALVNAAANFDAKTKIAELLVNAIASLSAQAGDIAAVTKASTTAVSAATTSKERSAADEAELKVFREDDPTLKELRGWANTCMITGVFVLLAGIVGTWFMTSVPIIGPFLAKYGYVVIGAGGFLIAAGFVFSFLAKHMTTLENTIGGGAIAAGCGAAVWFAIHWWRNRNAAKEIVATVDAGVASGAITWTADATALANKLQSAATQALVDLHQAIATPAKPSIGVHIGDDGLVTLTPPTGATLDSTGAITTTSTLPTGKP